jgi:hypothetical protein
MADILQWLHKSAFSWGGLQDSGADVWDTSQVPENLLFGTSETNSVMIRYLHLVSQVNSSSTLLTHLALEQKRLGKVFSIPKPTYIKPWSLISV